MTSYNNTLIGASILSFCGLPGNLLIIILIYRTKQKKSTTTYLLLSLAIADIVNLLGVDIAAVLICLAADLLSMKMALLLTVPAKIAANSTLAALSLERYNALVKALKPCSYITKRKILSGVIISWFVGLAPTTSMLLHSFWRPKNEMILTAVHWVTLLLPGYLIPLGIVLFCYSSIIKGLYYDRTILGQKVPDKASLSDKKRLIRILVLITLVFLVCNLPVIIITSLSIRDCYGIGMILGCSSSFLNPFIYGLQSEKYRNQVKELFCKKQESETVRYSPHVFDTKM